MICSSHHNLRLVSTLVGGVDDDPSLLKSSSPTHTISSSHATHSTMGRWLLIKVLLIVTALFYPAWTQDVSPGELHYTVQEETHPGTPIGNIYSDAALDDRYSRSELNNVQFQFLLTPTIDLDLEVTSGMLLTGGRVDRDTMCANDDECRISMDVVVTTPLRLLEIVKVVVEVLDINDNDPVFADDVITIRIPESADIGNSFVLPGATDADSGHFGVAGYRLLSNSTKFELNTRESLDGSINIRLMLRENLDRERVTSYRARLVAYDGGAPARTGSADVRILVQDANDNDPQFDNSTYEISVIENVDVGSKILQVHARDRDEGLYGEVVYSFSPRTQSLYGSLFNINNRTGEIYVAGELDHEDHQVFHLAVVAHDRGPNSVPAEANVVINLIDINDNAPHIVVNTIAAPGTDRAEVEEGAMRGTFVAYVTVTDPDSGDNGRFDCTLDDDGFALQRRFVGEYQIITTEPLNREASSVYDLEISCTDHGRLSQTRVKTIYIYVRDINDQTPEFTRITYEGRIIENNLVGAFVAQVNATDGDSDTNAEITYKMEEGARNRFKINPLTGRITAQSVFDRETLPEVTFLVFAEDHGTPSNTGTATVIVTVGDVNDEQPTFENEKESFGVFENEDEGSLVGQVTARDLDDSPYNELVYLFLPSADAETHHFSIDPETGEIYTVAALDRERKSEYHLIVSATDKGVPPLSSTVSVDIFVADRNDHAPTWIYPLDHNKTVSISPQTPINHLIATVSAIDEDKGVNSKLNYSIVRGNDEHYFKMNVSSGGLYVASSMSHIDIRQFNIQVLCEDHGYPSQRSLADLHVIVNKSIIFEHSTMLLGGHNFIVVVCLAAVTLTVVIILIVAIILVCARTKKRETHKYNCRAEEMKKDAERGEKQKELAAMQVDGNGHNTLTRAVQPEYGTVRSSGGGGGTLGRHPSITAPTSPHYATPQHPVPVPVWVQNARNHQHEHQYLRSPRTIVVGDPLDVIDTDSAYSGDGSNTDSGRGASEEGGENGCPPGAPPASANATNGPVGHYHKPNGTAVTGGGGGGGPTARGDGGAYGGGHGSVHPNTNASSPSQQHQQQQPSPPGGAPSSPGAPRCHSPYTEVPIVPHRNYDPGSLVRGNPSSTPTSAKKLHTFSPPQACTPTHGDQWKSTDKLLHKSPRGGATRDGALNGDNPAGCHGYQNFEYIDDPLGSSRGAGSLSLPPDVVPDDISSTSGSYTVDESGCATPPVSAISSLASNGTTTTGPLRSVVV